MQTQEQIGKYLQLFGIKRAQSIIHNPDYAGLFEAETQAGLSGYERAQVTSSGATAVDTGIVSSTGRYNAILNQGGRCHETKNAHLLHARTENDYP